MNSPDSPVPQRYDIKTKASVEIGQEMDALDFTGSKEYAPSMRSFLGERRNNFMTFATSPFVMLVLIYGNPAEQNVGIRSCAKAV